MRRTIAALFVFSMTMIFPALVALGASDRYLVENGQDAGGLLYSDSGAPRLWTYATDPTAVGLTNQGATTIQWALCTAASCTRNAPTTALEGLGLDQVAAYRVSVCVAYGTLAGTGNLRARVRDPEGVVPWQPMPGKDLAVTGTGQCMAFPVEVNTMRGNGYRLHYQPDAVGVNTNDGGIQNLIVTIRACVKGGCAP